MPANDTDSQTVSAECSFEDFSPSVSASFSFFLLSVTPHGSLTNGKMQSKTLFEEGGRSKLQAVALCSPLYPLLYGQIGESCLLKRGSRPVLISFPCLLECNREAI